MTHTTHRIPLILLVALLAAACGGPAEQATPTPEPPKELRVYMLDGAPIRQVADILIKGYAQRHPGATVKLVPFNDEPAKELARLAESGGSPDVVWSIDSLSESLIEADLLLDMRELASVDQTVDLDGVNPVALSAINGQDRPGLYFLPASLETVQMFYNKTLFEKAGAPLPEAAWTWDDLIGACGLIQAASPDVTCLGFSNPTLPGPEWWLNWGPWVRGYGGSILSEDGKTSQLSSFDALAGFQAYADLWTRHKVARLQERGDCFAQQKCAVVFFVTAGTRLYRETVGDRFEWDVQLMPAHPKGQFSATAVYGFGIARGTQNREAAWDFVKYLVSPEAQKLILDNRLGLPVLTSLASGPEIAQLPPPPANMRAFVDGAAMGIAPWGYPSRCGNLYIGLAQTVIGQAVNQVINGADAEEAFKAADQKIQACLDGN
jgi:multiple sugar transport system substrate-binding protein